LRQRDIEVWHHAVDDIRDQLAHLVYAGFVAATPQQHLVELPRFLAAIALRLDRLRAAPQRDEQNTLEIARLWQNYRAFLKRGGGVLTQDQDAVLHEFRWMLEELRVSLFAQELKTAYPVSIKRAAKHLAALSAAL
jgi:ATP-dependent helicase HrpA